MPGDLASQYNDFLLTEEVMPGTKLMEGDLMIKQNGQLVKPVRLPNGLYKFRSTEEAACLQEEHGTNIVFPGMERQRIAWCWTA